jgi:hypothetical protein
MTVPEGSLRRFRLDAASDALSTPQSVRRLEQLAVPLQVGPYFVTADDEPVQLHEYANAVGRRVIQEGSLAWARLGSDGGFEICSDPGGVVRAVLLDINESPRFVSSTPEAFAQSLGELNKALDVILATDSPDTAAEAFEHLERQLHVIDPEAFAELESWWPLVLDDIKDTASTEWFTAFEIVNGRGEKQILTGTGGIGIHPEEKLWQSLRAAGVQADQVLRIHTELEACFMPGHYCSMWLGEVFPDAQLTHNFPYGETAASRAEGIQQLREAAEQRPQ